MNRQLISNSTLRLGLSIVVLWGLGASARAADGPVTGPIPSRYSLAVRLEPAPRRISAVARIELAHADGAKPVTFLLNKQLTVTSARDGDQAAAFSYGPPGPEARPLLVKLAQRSGSPGPRKLTIEYRGTIAPPGAKDPNWMGALVLRTNEIRMTEQTKWYPTLEGRKAPFEASITLPAEFTLIWPGKASKTMEPDGQATWRVVCTNRVAPALIAGIYSQAGQPPVRVCLFPACAGEAEAILEQGRDIVAFLESRFGASPFGQVSICQMEVLNGRFSYNFAAPGAVVLPGEIIRMARRPDRKAFWTRKLAHELAHQWWGCSVDLPREPWPLSESLAELSAVLYLQSLQPEKPLGSFLEAEAKGGRQLSGLARNGASPSARDLRRCLAYQKGPWMLVMARESLGAERFGESLRRFWAQNAFGQPTLDDFLNSFGAGETLPLPMFFSQWIKRPVLPRLTVEGVGGPGQAIVLRVNQAEPVFTLPLELRLTTAAGAALTSCLLTQAQQRIQTQIRSPLLGLEVDPGGKLLLEIQSDTNHLVQTLLQARTCYQNLLAAHRANKPTALFNQAHDLRDTFREFKTALEIERLRQYLAGKKSLDARTKMRLDEYEQQKSALEAFFGSRGQEAELRRLVGTIAESADEIHDCIRDKTPEPIAGHLKELTQAWKQFSQMVRTCSGIGY